jgi:GntR family transcriptional regulator, N-acetylglucosamine utilization regulator
VKSQAGTNTAPDTLPKYLRISRDIVARIQRGELPVGGLVPSENELIERFGVSNTIARKALQEAERGGWVVRVKGKGTFVRQNRVDRSVTRILGFTRNRREAGRAPSTRLVRALARKGGRQSAMNGRLYLLRGPVCEIERVRFADGVPMMREIRYISLRFCPGIQKKPLEGSLYDLYEREYKLQLTQVDQTLSAIQTPRDLLEVFGLEAPGPAFRVEGVTFCGKELVLEMEDSIYRGDMYQFSVKATR